MLRMSWAWEPRRAGIRRAEGAARRDGGAPPESIEGWVVRSPGRPRGVGAGEAEPPAHVSVLLPAGMVSALDAAAERLGMTRSAAARAAVEAWLGGGGGR